MRIPDRLFYFAMPAALLAGIFLGTTAACRQDTSALFLSAAESFSSPSMMADSFLHALIQNAGLGVLLFVLGTTVLGVLPSAFFLGLRGYAAGYAVGALVTTFGFRGFFAAACGVFPHNLLYIPFLCLLAISGARFGRRLLLKSAPARFPSYIFSSLLLMLPLLFGCFVEGYVSAPLLRLILASHI